MNKQESFLILHIIALLAVMIVYITAQQSLPEILGLSMSVGFLFGAIFGFVWMSMIGYLSPSDETIRKEFFDVEEVTKK